MNKDERETYKCAHTHKCIMVWSRKSLFQGGLQVCVFLYNIFLMLLKKKTTLEACTKKVPHLITPRRNGTGRISKGGIISTLCLSLYLLNHMETVFTQHR